MLRDRRFITRHKILAALSAKEREADKQQALHQGAFLMTLEELAKATNLPEEEVLQQDDFLLNVKEIDLSEIETGEPLQYMITPDGIAAYADKKYLNERLKEKLRLWWDWIQIICTVVTLIIGVLAFVINMIETQRNSGNILQLQQKVERLEKEQMKPAPVKNNSIISPKKDLLGR